ncbi:MAG TPA: hypothetical protein VF144_21830, partial [Chitinophagaceae bacterium]
KKEFKVDRMGLKKFYVLSFAPHKRHVPHVQKVFFSFSLDVSVAPGGAVSRFTFLNYKDSFYNDIRTRR